MPKKSAVHQKKVDAAVQILNTTTGVNIPQAIIQAGFCGATNRTLMSIGWYKDHDDDNKNMMIQWWWYDHDGNMAMMTTWWWWWYTTTMTTMTTMIQWLHEYDTMMRIMSIQQGWQYNDNDNDNTNTTTIKHTWWQYKNEHDDDTMAMTIQQCKNYRTITTMTIWRQYDNMIMIWQSMTVQWQ